MGGAHSGAGVSTPGRLATNEALTNHDHSEQDRLDSLRKVSLFAIIIVAAVLSLVTMWTLVVSRKKAPTQGIMGRVQRARRRKLIAAVLVVLSMLVIAHPAQAGWLTWVGVGLLVAAVAIVAVGVATIPVGGLVVAGVLVATTSQLAVAAAVTEVAAVACISIDVARGDFANAPPVNRPALARAPETPAPPADLANNQFSPLPSSGNQTDAMVTAANGVIDAANILIDDAHNHPGQFAQDFPAFPNAFTPLSNATAALFHNQESSVPGLTFSQATINSTLGDIASSGLPPVLASALVNQGFPDVQGLSNFVGGTQVNLAVPSVTTSQLEGSAANLTFVSTPEPSTLVLSGIGAIGLIGYGWRRRRRAAA
jgi:hypothetical protein